jgi:hypothetical protein
MTTTFKHQRGAEEAPFSIKLKEDKLMKLIGTIFEHEGQQMKIEVENYRGCKIGRLSIQHWTKTSKGVHAMKWTEIYSFSTYQDWSLFQFKKTMLDNMPQEQAL